MDNGASSYRRFLDGDDNGIVEIIRDYKDGLILFLNRYVHNVHIAEELTEDTFFRIITRKPRFAARYSFKTWLYTIGRNIAINYVKHERRMVDTSAEDLELLSEDEETLEQSYLREEQKIMVHHALSKIKSNYGTVLYLKFFENLTNEQIAKVTKKNRRQIENQIYQAKQSLRAELEKEGFSYEGL
jgi:RNA polymerase sigma-70 factor (ECF subfamily)